MNDEMMNLQTKIGYFIISTSLNGLKLKKSTLNQQHQRHLWLILFFKNVTKNQKRSNKVRTIEISS
jgi:hypothetical protein